MVNPKIDLINSTKDTTNYNVVINTNAREVSIYSNEISGLRVGT